MHDYNFITVDGITLLEHRYVMEQIIGRKLLPNEIVHHINANKRDNNRNNKIKD